jgi:hypothetical protein
LKVSAPKGKRSYICTWLPNGVRRGYQAFGPPVPNGYALKLPLSDPTTPAVGAEASSVLGLGVCAAVLRDDSEIEASNILCSHTAVCRFVNLSAEDVASLDPLPEFAIALGDVTWCLWPLSTAVSADELRQLHEYLRDDFGGDPSWDASPVELVPLPGVVYSVGGDDLEAVELEIPA